MGKKSFLAWSPVRDLMKSVGASIVARDAVNLMIKYLEEEATRVTSQAMKLTRHSKRTKVTKEDIELALKL